MAQLIERLAPDDDQQHQALTIFEQYLDDRSVIVRVNGLQALATLAERDATLRPAVVARTGAGSGGGEEAWAEVAGMVEKLRNVPENVSIRPLNTCSIVV